MSTDQLAREAFARGDIAEFTKLQSEAKAERIAAEIADGDFASALTYCGSEDVAATLVELAPLMTDEQLREIVLHEWTRCEAHLPYRAALVDIFRRTGFVADVKPPWNPERKRALTIFRGNQGEDEPAGICWTMTVEWGEFFARWAQSARGAFLGIRDPDGIPTVWQAQVHAADVLAYFNERDEQEVVVDPDTVFNAVAIREARPGGS